MLSLNLPSYEIKIAQRNGSNVIFDMLRKRYVALTPEEWVRQHFVHYLPDYKGYAAKDCPLCREVQKQDGIVNTFGLVKF